MVQERDIGGEQRAILSQVLEHLSGPLQHAFWRHVALVAKRLSHTGRDYARLCLAVHDADSGAARPRLFASAMPVARRLSAEDLQRAVLRLKSRLLQTATGAPYVAHQFCMWVQVEYRLTLLAILDATGCPHDDKGVLNGPFPALTVDIATSAINGLCSKYDDVTLAAVCGALLIDGLPAQDRWSALRPVLETLLSKEAPLTSNGLMTQATAHSMPAAGTVDAATSAPDQAWHELLERCGRVKHVSDPNFSGASDIALAIASLRGVAGKDATPSLDAMAGMAALLRVIEQGDLLDDMAFEEARGAIDATFGASVATAAVRGRLRIETSAPPPALVHNDPLPVIQHLSKESAPSIAESAAVDITPAGTTNDVLSTPVEVGRFCAYADDFEQDYWIDGTGAVTTAPWRDADYTSRLSQAAVAAWQATAFGKAYIHAASLETLGAPGPFWLDDLQHADQLLSAPTSLQAGIDERRVMRLRAVLHEPSSTPLLGVGLALTLEAMRPTHPCTLSTSEIDQLLERAGFRNASLVAVLGWTLNAWAAGANPLPQLRESAQASPPEDHQVLQQALISAEQQFKDTVAQYWNAAGGRLQQTHCRKAWMRFILDDIAPLRTDFGYSSKALRLNATELHNRLRAGISRLAALYPERMANVKYQDRVAADNAAQQIFDKLYQLSEVLQRVAVQQRQAKHAFDSCPHDDIRRLTTEVHGEATDQLCIVIITAVLRAERAEHPLQLDAALLATYPDLVKHVRDSAVAALSQVGARIALQDIVDVRAASALLLDAPALTGERDEDILMTVRQVAIERERRDVLSALAPSHVLASHERTLLLQSALEIAEDLYARLRDLERLWTVCDLLMIEQANSLQKICVEARERVTHVDTINSLIDGRQLQAWLATNIAAAKACVHAAIKARVALAHARSAEAGQTVEKLLQQERYREAARVLHGEAPLADDTVLPARETLWRTEAVAVYAEPRRALMTTLRGDQNKAQVELTTRWLAAAADSGQRDVARRALYTFVSREYDTRRRSIVRLTDLRDLRERKIVIDCAVLREYFQRAGHNPTFLPQLADFSKIILTTAGSDGAIRGSAILDDWARLVAAEAEGALVVFLEPGLSAARRDELSDGLRRRRLTAAIIDDVDVCRLCTASGRTESAGFVGLLEIVLEQLDLSRVSPFSTQDGQHVRIESYVGRADEAEKLALRNTYSCVFSGRKLGKSALLKYVARKYDGHLLGSGMQLNVIFITIAGGESEHWIVQCIIDEMARRFDMVEEAISGSQRPRDRLSAYMHRFLQQHPNSSLLLVLDEADTFVEGQLANYDNDREASLSFCLLKELPAQVDNTGFPRIRTVFSGYRVTNTRDGVWANAGDVLVLRPLEETEAVQFTTGMLAKIGIDIDEHAAYVARRCGFQPAVLIRFGESLLKHIARTNLGGRREVIAVSEALVSAALNDQGVQDEIRTVVANNFQGHKVGQVVFTATLMALKELSPGHALLDAPAQILAKLREIDADLGWLERLNASPMAVIESNLQNFIDRELMTMSQTQRFGEREYRLKFPHFLPVLTHADMALDARQLIAAVRASSKQSPLNRCALAPTSLEKVRYWYREPDTALCRLIVVGGHWLSALLHPKSGVPDRLGCSAKDVVHLLNADDIAPLAASGVRVFADPPLAAWPVMLAADFGRPIVVIGSIAWLRRALEYVLEGGEVPLEIVGQGRLTEGTISWWIESARALHLTSPALVPAVARLCGGIPLLTGVIDSLIPGAPASELTETDLRAVGDAFEQQLHTIAGMLLDQSADGGLTIRERELLIMARHVAIALEGTEFDLETEFRFYWEMCDVASVMSVDPPLSRPEDRLALQLLVSTGLLSVVDEGASSGMLGLGRARIDPQGPLARLVRLVEGHHAG